MRTAPSNVALKAPVSAAENHGVIGDDAWTLRVTVITGQYRDDMHLIARSYRLACYLLL
jgi:hypothetical protein